MTDPICDECVEVVKINTPRAYSNGKRIKVVIGESIKLIIPIEGSSKPVCTWTKGGEDLKPDENGRPRFMIRSVNDSSTLFLRNSDRWDTGTYNLKVVVGEKTATVDFDVAVLDLPTKPRQLVIADVVASTAQIKWMQPKDDGNCDIIGYQVEKRAAKSDEWFVCIPKIRGMSVQINDLVMGNAFYFRVRAFNEVGFGDEAVTKDCAVILKDTMVYKKPVLPPLDFGMKPEFTKPFCDVRVMSRFNGVLTSSLRAHPKPKLTWYKGKTEIIDNPKYKTTCIQGIVQLEVRRARPGDAGNYRLVAENNLGIAETFAQIVVKEVK